MAKNIKKRSDDYAQWYLDVIKAAKLADHSPVRGCMVIRPEGFAIWEAIQRDLDRRFKATGHVNAYFPLLIPQSFLTKEAQHVEGFALECAVVTHSKLEKDGEGKLRPASPIEEPLIIRPTSETIIGHMYSEWVQSYRDLPLLINQWCNVMRWEMRTRLFLRTSEFLWQEGHTAHETEAEAQEETLKMLDVYADFAENVLAVPVVRGAKTDSEKFPGAVTTYCIEGLMQDGKALQMGTSHNLGQNFSKAFEIKFLGRTQQQEFAWTTSWGVSTRLIGAVIMAHSDDEGLVLPPRVAPDVVAIVPIFKTPEDEAKVRGFVDKLVAALTGDASAAKTAHHGLERYVYNTANEQRILADFRDARPGDKQYHWEQRGVPFRIEVGPRDVDGGAFVLKSRIGGTKEIIKLEDLQPGWLKARLDAAHDALFQKAVAYREANTRDAATYDELKEIIKGQGGFVRCFFKPDRAAEAKIKEQTKATVRCIPFAQPGTSGKCIYSGEETTTQVLFAQAY
ncbi:proline--tRNA ligase [Humisphaera borealis]|uniref:Proline--tRNA ligase n=1 Tax=Humisphaera borealis TaxID=2807512 RepID=A0A7M2WWP0_9BACT|nr:proline--tRNA ligase [Humisphaera borealis]QOV89251.1 proline--tRNA ligase [Humisphaera borealis]